MLKRFIPNLTEPCSTVELPQTTSDFVGDEGIQQYSTDERYFIVSVDNNYHTEFSEWLAIEQIGHKLLLGSYKHTVDYSFIINARDWHKVRDSGFINNQECVLYLWSHAYGYVKYGVNARMATMYNLVTGETTELGCFVAINDSDASKYDGWTYDIANKQFYTCKETFK